MSTLTCPRCKKENAYSDIEDVKGLNYVCPDCFFIWADTSVTIDEDDDDFDEDEDDNEDEDISQSEIYANYTVSELLKSIIKNFDKYRIDSKYLSVITSIYMVVTDYEKYQVNGYIHFTIKDTDEDENVSFMEIQIDQDGLSLTKGGYLQSENGGDSYSESVYQNGDEDNLILTQEAVDEFVNEYQEMLKSPTKEYEIFDSGDGIEEIK